MVKDITVASRKLSPFERLILESLCEGKTNSAIAMETAHTEKVIENTVSRSAHVFGIKADSDTNLRVLLALAYRTHYGDQAFEKLGIACSKMEIGPGGRHICSIHRE